jgi:hypothetical protein
MAGSARLAVLRLGRIGWTQAEVVQKALVASKTEAAAAIRGRRATAATGQGDSTGAPAVPDDVLLLCEHPPVYTTGRRMQVQPCMVFAAHCLPMPTPRSHTVGVWCTPTHPHHPPDSCSQIPKNSGCLRISGQSTCTANGVVRRRFTGQVNSWGTHPRLFSSLLSDVTGCVRPNSQAQIRSCVTGVGLGTRSLICERWAGAPDALSTHLKRR